MATRTSTQSGPWSDTATWGGSAKPGDGDIAVITSGHTVTVDEDTTIGSNSSGVGYGIQILATDGTTYGKVVVSGGFTLTLKGNDRTTNCAMRIERYAVFEPEPGSTVRVDCASDFQTIIDNRGIINAIGTSGSRITFDSPAANYSWNNAGSTVTSGSGSWYAPGGYVRLRPLTNVCIANAAGTGLGSLGDSSVSFSSLTPATLCTNEVASIALVVAEGDYYIDYDLGIVWFYTTSPGDNPSWTANYKYLTNAKGWGISSVQNTTYNEAKFDYCDFRYMGQSASAETYALDVKYKQSAAVASNRIFYTSNCTFSYCHRALSVRLCTGTSGDPIVVSACTFNEVLSSGTYGAMFNCFRSYNTHTSFTGNTFRSRQSIIYFTPPYGSVVSYVGLKVTGNTFVASSVWSTGPGITFPDADFSGNTVDGLGATNDPRLMSGVSGESGAPVVVTGNTVRFVPRLISMDSYMEIHDNLFLYHTHHGIFGSTGDILKSEGCRIYNNLFYGEGDRDGSPAIETGYNKKLWIDDLRVYGNTFSGTYQGWFGFGDLQDGSTYTLCTRLVVANNLAVLTSSAGTGLRRVANASDKIWRGHVQLCDYNLDYNYATRYANWTTQGMFHRSGVNYSEETISTRNLPGVALFDPSFASATGKTLDFVFTSHTDQTLDFDGGTPVQLSVPPGGTSTNTATGGANNSDNGVVGLLSGYLDDSAAAFPTTKTDANCPLAHWVRITGGTGAGQVRAVVNNTSTRLTVVPAWTTPPDATSTYAIIRSEVTLTDGADSVHAGIYLPDFPVATAGDTGIDFTDHSITGSDPDLVDATSDDVADYKVSAGSPAIDAGLDDYAAALDYFGTSRPVGLASDIGFHEYNAPASTTRVVLL